MSIDPSNGYDAIAQTFIDTRGCAGGALIKRWAESLPPEATIVDVGAGYGEPLTRILMETGLRVWAIEASPKLAQAFRKRFPTTDLACEAAETSAFFNERFDAILCVGLVFLLSEHGQAALLKRFAAVLKPSGRLLFSAPWQIGSWDDLLTGRQSHSLGRTAYIQLLENQGLKLIATHEDEGGSHYYEAQKPWVTCP